jgi:predicted metal-dependent phosphoesterase TrpH
LTPEELVTRAAAVGVTVLAVTDHDTVAGGDAAAAACKAAGLTFVPGIEITATSEGVDVHVLGYFIDRHAVDLERFLANERRRRVDRIRQIVDRLAGYGIALDADAILQPAVDDPTRAVGRPWVARALVKAGHVANTAQAFDLWLARGKPAFVPRTAAPPAEVIARIHEAGGIASIAHPALLGHDGWIREFAAAGLDAIEAYHTDHDADATRRYLALAAGLELDVSGGSDYHADDSHGAIRPGAVSLPRPDYERLVRRAEVRA